MDRGGEPRWSRGGVRSPLVSATSTADTDTTFERAATDPCGVPTMLLGAERERTAEADREELVEDDVERPWLPPRGGGRGATGCRAQRACCYRCWARVGARAREIKNKIEQASELSRRRDPRQWVKRRSYLAYLAAVVVLAGQEARVV